MSILEIFSPYDLTKIGEVQKHSLEQVKEMLVNAHKFFHDSSKHLKPYQRIEILNKLINLIKREEINFTTLIATEGGKPWVDANFEAVRAISGVESAIAEIHKIGGMQTPMELTPFSINRTAFSIKEPIGVVFAVSAFNHPLNLLIHQIIPAIAVGCPIIIKPASTTPMTCLKLVDLLYEAGLPELYCQVAICDAEVTTQILQDSKVAFFNFIGSGKVGWELVKMLAPGTRYCLEHGGVAPVIIDSNVDLNKVALSLAKGAFYHAGQVCVSSKRIYVPKNMVKQFNQVFAEIVAKLKVGNPLAKDTDVGPLILPKEVDRVDSWVKEAIDLGGELIIGGERLSQTTYAPTIIYNPPENALVSKNETFGPVACVYSYEDIEDAIDRANSLPYAFQAALFSDSLNFAMKVAKKIDSASIMINDHSAYRADWMPFGGRRASGFGMGGIVNNMHDLLQNKMILFNLN